MYHENSIKENSIIIGICVILYLFSPSASIPVSIEEVQAKEIKTASGALESRMDETVSSSGKTDKKSSMDSWKQTWVGKVLDCNADCKIKTLIEIGIREEIAESLFINCKALADNPVRCIKVWAFIVVNESWGWFKCRKANRFSCFGIMVADKYKSFNDGVIHFVWKYNKYWKNQETPDSFYSNSPNWKPVTRYCMSEDSSWLPYCKNWHRIAWSVYNKLSKSF